MPRKKPDPTYHQDSTKNERFQELKKALITCFFQERLRYGQVLSELSLGIAREAQLRSASYSEAARVLGTSLDPLRRTTKAWMSKRS